MRLKQVYQEKVIPELQKELKTKNILAIPKLVKVSINIGLGEARSNPKFIESVKKEIAQISGQQPRVRRARKAIAGFKIRQGQDVALSVTLRSDKMYDFVEKLINLILPRIRDFRGLENSGFDQHGSYSLGFKDQIIFPEIKYDDVIYAHGLQVTIVTTAKTPSQAMTLLKVLGFPFKK